jgi:hypothetical protein
LHYIQKASSIFLGAFTYQVETMKKYYPYIAATFIVAFIVIMRWLPIKPMQTPSDDAGLEQTRVHAKASPTTTSATAQQASKTIPTKYGDLDPALAEKLARIEFNSGNLPINNNPAPPVAKPDLSLPWNQVPRILKNELNVIDLTNGPRTINGKLLYGTEYARSAEDQKWQENQGYPTRQHLERSWDRDALKIAAAKNDLLALNLLATQDAIENKHGNAQSSFFARRAVLLGSTYAMRLIALSCLRVIPKQEPRLLTINEITCATNYIMLASRNGDPFAFKLLNFFNTKTVGNQLEFHGYYSIAEFETLEKFFENYKYLEWNYENMRQNEFGVRQFRFERRP